MWVLCALSGRFGLSYSMRKTLRGQKLNEAWMTWECPPELLGKESSVRDLLCIENITKGCKSSCSSTCV